MNQLCLRIGNPWQSVIRLLMLIIAMTMARPARAQETGFRVGDMVYTSTYYRPWTLASDNMSQSMERKIFTTVYTYGVGITNDANLMSSWALTSSDYLSTTANRLSHTDRTYYTNEWIWVEGAPVGNWTSSRYINWDIYVYRDPYSSTTVTTDQYNPRSLFIMGFGDWFNGFKGPVGTITTTNDFGGTTTETYTTTAGLFVPGDPASTNEHFYRVQLSLEQADHSAILMSSVTSYLGQPPDLNSNVYVWLQEGQEYTAKPVFRNFTPTFYSYSAEANRADKLGTLLITTIKDMGGSWPGNPPSGVFQRLGYPAADFDPTGDQIAFDVLMNTPVATLFNAAITLAVQLRGLALNWEKDTNRGSLNGLSEEDRKYVTMVFLKRSANADSPDFLTYEALDAYTSFTNRFGYRLINELSVEAGAYQSQFGHAIAGRNLLRRQSKIGNTRLTISEPVDLSLIIYPGTSAAFPLTITLDEGWVNPFISGTGTIFQNDPGGGHNQMIGGAKGSTNVYNIAAGRAGWLLRQVEEPLLRRTPPDFSSWVIYRAVDNSVTLRRRLSAWTNDVPEVNTT